MAFEENKKLALTAIEALNARDMSIWSQNLADDFLASPPGVPALNKTQAQGYLQRFVIAFPDVYFDVQHVLAEGDYVFTHWTASGTHTERLATVTGETIPPTRRSVAISGVLLTEIRDGQITREYQYWDQLALMTQLGLSEQPGLFCLPRGSAKSGLFYTRIWEDLLEARTLLLYPSWS